MSNADRDTIAEIIMDCTGLPRGMPEVGDDGVVVKHRFGIFFAKQGFKVQVSRRLTADELGCIRQSLKRTHTVGNEIYFSATEATFMPYQFFVKLIEE